MADSEWIRFCQRCLRPFAFEDREWRCACGGILSLPKRSVYGPHSHQPGVWRYGGNLSIGGANERISLGEGDTPLVRLRSFPGDVFAKLEFLAPTGSFKDRGAATAVSRFASIGITSIVDDSAGNAGVSLAAYCAAAGIECNIHALISSSAARVNQLRTYGARFIPVQGDRAAATAAAIHASGSSHYAGHAWDPFFIEGLKTIAYELVEQLANNPPAHILFPLGQGTLLLGLLRGFDELMSVGIMERRPQLIAVQTDVCAPLHTMFRDGLASLPTLFRPPRVLADGIAVPAPVRWSEVIAVARAGAVRIVSVPDAAIPAAIRRLGAGGLHVEPTSATVLAAFEHELNRGGLNGATVLILTSSGLKSSAGIAGALTLQEPCP